MMLVIIAWFAVLPHSVHVATEAPGFKNEGCRERGGSAGGQAGYAVCDKTASHTMVASIKYICVTSVKDDTAYSERPGQQTQSASHINRHHAIRHGSRRTTSATVWTLPVEWEHMVVRPSQRAPDCTPSEPEALV